MLNALIFSPSFSGHRQVYVFVIADVLDKLGFKLYVAGNFSDNLNNTYYIDKLKENKSISFIDTVGYDGKGIQISNIDFRLLQKKNNINLTVFAEADNHIPLIVSQMLSNNQRFQGKLIGIFLRPFHIYHKIKFLDKLRYLKHLHSNWKTDVRFFHELLNRRNLLLDKSLHIDEYFASKHKKIISLPDVFQQYADKLVIEEHSDQRKWIGKLDDFKKSNKDRLLLLYFGTAQQRRGYDQLLKLAIDHKACFIHCGLRNDNDNYGYNIDDLRGNLVRDNSLFETNEYITDPICIEFFFKSVSHLLLPYDNFYGSSGVMLQALGYNIPVLVPDIGIIGYRVKKYNLGQTYNAKSFEKQFLSFIKTPKEMYSKSIEKYMKFQSADRLGALLINTFKS